MKRERNAHGRTCASASKDSLEIMSPVVVVWFGEVADAILGTLLPSSPVKPSADEPQWVRNPKAICVDSAIQKYACRCFGQFSMTAKKKYFPLGMAVDCITADQHGNKDIDDEIDNPQHQQGGTYLTERLGRCHGCTLTNEGDFPVPGQPRPVKVAIYGN